MGLALDEPSEEDEVQDEPEFKVVIEKRLLDQFGGVNIEFQNSRWMGSGFSIRPTQQFGQSCC